MAFEGWKKSLELNPLQPVISGESHSAAEEAEATEESIEDFDALELELSPEGIAVFAEQVKEKELAVSQLRAAAPESYIMQLVVPGYESTGAFSAVERIAHDLRIILDDIKEQVIADPEAEIDEAEIEQLGELYGELDYVHDAIVAHFDALLAAEAPDAHEVSGEPELEGGERSAANEGVPDFTTVAKQINDFHKVAASWFPESVRTAEIADTLDELQNLINQAEYLGKEQLAGNAHEYGQREKDMLARVASLESALRQFHKQLQPEIKAAREGEREGETEVPMPAHEQHTFAEASTEQNESNESLPTAEVATELVRTIDSNPYYATEERATVRWFYDAVLDSVAANDSAVEQQKKLANLESTVGLVAEHATAETMRERAERVARDIEQLPFADAEERETAQAMYKNLVRKYNAEEPEESVRQAYENLEAFVLDAGQVEQQVFGVILPTAGPGEEAQVRALRRELIGRTDSRSGEALTPGQRSDIEQMITILQYAAHDQLSVAEATELADLARRVRARTPIAPHDPESYRELDHVEGLAEEDSRPTTGGIEFAADEDDEEIVLPIINKTESEDQETELETGEAEASETSEALEETNEHHDEPTATTTSDSSVGSISHAPLRDAQQSRTWEQRRGSLADKHLTAAQREVLKERGMSLRDLDRHIVGFVGAFERRFESKLDAWLGEPTESVFKKFQQRPLSELEALAKQYSASKRAQLQEDHGLKYDALIAWTDQIEEMEREIGQADRSTTLGELVTQWIATQELG